MDPTHKKHPKSAPFTTKPHHLHHHPQPDPTTFPSPPPSTIKTISHHFSKLYTTIPKKPEAKPVDKTRFQAHKLPTLDSSCTTLTKSSSQHERQTYPQVTQQTKHFTTSSSRTKVKEKHIVPSHETIKKPSKKEQPTTTTNKPSSCDVKKTAQLLSRSLENDQMTRSRDGFEMRKPSVSSIPMTGVGARRSFCSSLVELADFLACNGVKVVAVDMPPFMQIHAVDCARKTRDSLEKLSAKTIAFTLKKEFDGEYGPAWHCIVGTSFGSFVTHSVGGFMYFSLDHKLYVLLFKTTVQRAD